VTISSYTIAQETTPNVMERFGWKPDMIVDHITEGSYLGAISWLQNPKSGASAHFVISRTGLITQLVDIRKAAWVNGTSLDPAENKYYGNSLLKIVRERKTNANFFSVGIEHEGIYAQTKGLLSDAQLDASIWLHKYIITEIKRIYGTDIILDREHIVGHYQVDPIRKPNCPGQKFQWDVLLNALKGEDEEMINTLVLKEEWQWTMLLENVRLLKTKGFISGTDWETKVINKTITTHELAWLNNEVISRLIV